MIPLELMRIRRQYFKLGKWNFRAPETGGGEMHASGFDGS